MKVPKLRDVHLLGRDTERGEVSQEVIRVMGMESR